MSPTANQEETVGHHMREGEMTVQGGDRDGAAEAAQEARRAPKRRLLPALGH